MRQTLTRSLPLGLLVSFALAACSGDSGNEDDSTSASASVTVTASITATGTTTMGTTSVTGGSTSSTTAEKFDLGDDTIPGCSGDGACNLLDILFVIDNSGSMGEEQSNLAANFPLLVERLGELKDSKGKLISADINMMVTTSDMGHPACAPFNKPDYSAAKGAPQNIPCSSQLDRFTSLDGKKSIPEVCTNACPNGVAPMGPYIHYKVNGASNVAGDDISGALSCIGLQGIDGCGYEAQLESMMQALNPSAEWNKGASPFLRDGAVLAVVIVTDEADCSVLAPAGYDYFDDKNADNPGFNQYWATDPKDQKKKVTSSVCWNGGVNCIDGDNDGVYENCSSSDKGVLHPTTDRYIKFLRDVLLVSEKKEVLMLGILGIPIVTAHNDKPPYEPTAGGVKDLVYRQWKDGAYPAGDILPGDSGTAASKQFEFGIGPGCTGQDMQGNFTGQAIPPVRIKEVCESLNAQDRIRCCMESICDDDFSPAIECLSGLLQETFAPTG
ncbi:MAG: VWA domain-containing protein [Nannocystaceae bacterium]